MESSSTSSSNVAPRQYKIKHIEAITYDCDQNNISDVIDIRVLYGRGAAYVF